jgi:hypothetical protein
LNASSLLNRQDSNMTTASQPPSLSLTGKKVVVVGGKTGIGLGIARAALAAAKGQ